MGHAEKTRSGARGDFFGSAGCIGRFDKHAVMFSDDLPQLVTKRPAEAFVCGEDIAR